MTHTEFRILGPPGTGKTTTLSHEIGRAAEKYGSDQVLVASFTRAAAHELVSRNLPVDRGHVGTLHALCYRQLGRPVIAETRLDEWNAVCPPALRLSFTPSKRTAPEDRAERLVEEAPEDRSPRDHDTPETAAGDAVFDRYNVLRAQMRPRAAWPERVAYFAREFEAWKSERDYLDFTDLISVTYENATAAPGSPTVGFFDEVQDFTRQELELVRRWGERMSYIVLAGDDDQCIYSFKGATPDSFITPDLPPTHVRVLRQSHRVPRAVHAVAQRWIERVSRRAAKAYEPTADAGEARTLPTASWLRPERMIDDIERQLERGHECMVLAACSYQLAPTVAALRAAGIPFHNPYRRANGAWNPLRQKADGATTVARVLAYLRVDAATWGDDHRLWTGSDLALWCDLLSVESGVFKRGAKAQVTKLAGRDELGYEDLEQWFDAETITEPWIDPSIDWLEQRAMPSRRKALAFPAAIVRRRGGRALREEPRVKIGTIHSVKGGESDVVYLVPDLSAAGAVEWAAGVEGQDTIRRQLYVGMTRARRALVVLGPAGTAALSLV